MGKISDYMIRIAADDTHGYDQRYRDGKPDYDCSSLVIAAVKAAGYNTGSASYTGNMFSAFKKAGAADVTAQIDLKTGKGLKIDDILLTPGKHTAVYTGSGKITDARIAENGKAIAGKKGDQTGHEIETHSYYNYPWKHVLRFNDISVPATASAVDYTALAKDVIAGKYGNGIVRKKALGDKYYRVQAEVNRICREKMGDKRKTDLELAVEVLAGMYGTGVQRKNALGSRYHEVQKLVNKIIKEQEQ